MAANYWASTHRLHWCFSRQTLAEIRDEISEHHAKAVEAYPLPDRRLMFIYIKDRLHPLAKRLQSRQQCVATALVYIHRYLLSTPFQTVNLYLLIATAFYLASKTEESPNHIRLVASEARQAWPEYITGDISRIGEMEFSLISEMRSQLIVWHPYRTLLSLKEEKDLDMSNDEFELARCIINDSYMTDLTLTCAPHLIAIVAAFLAVIFAPSKQFQTQSFPSRADNSGVFSSIGGQRGVAGALSNAMASLPSSQHTGQSGAPAPMSSNGHQTPAGAWSTVTGSNGIANSAKIQGFIRFLVDSELEIEQLIEATQEIISLYQIWEQYDEKAVRDAVARYLKGRGLES